MVKDDRKKIEEIISSRKNSHKFFSQNSEVYNRFTEMESATYKDGELSRMQKELISVGISVVINCESCMQWHIKQAWDYGSSKQQLIEAIEVGIEMGGGPATVSARFAFSVLKYYGIL